MIFGAGSRDERQEVAAGQQERSPCAGQSTMTDKSSSHEPAERVIPQGSRRRSCHDQLLFSIFRVLFYADFRIAFGREYLLPFRLTLASKASGGD
jgi:hypothetical protein